MLIAILDKRGGSPGGGEENPSGLAGNEGAVLPGANPVKRGEVGCGASLSADALGTSADIVLHPCRKVEVVDFAQAAIKKQVWVGS